MASGVQGWFGYLNPLYFFFYFFYFFIYIFLFLRYFNSPLYYRCKRQLQSRQRCKRQPYLFLPLPYTPFLLCMLHVVRYSRWLLLLLLLEFSPLQVIRL